MVKLVVTCKRKTGMTLDEFQQYWRTDHAKLVAGQKGLRRYVQNHIIPAGDGSCEPVFDGVAEAWFEHPRAAAELVRSPEYAVVRADEANLVEPSSMVAMMTGEIVALESANPAETVAADAVKRITFLPKRSDVSVEQFERAWTETHAPMAARVPGCLRYVQCPRLRETGKPNRAPSIDGIEMAWFKDVDSLLAAEDSFEFARLALDRLSFVAVDRIATVIAREVEIGLRQPTTKASQCLEVAS